MTRVFATLLGVHLACALGATVLFWIAASAPKGGPVHRAVGRWFSRLVYAAAWTGGVMAIANIVAPAIVHAPDPAQNAAMLRLNTQTMWFVLYVLLLIVTPVQHGLAAVRASHEPRRVRSRLHGTLNLASMIGTFALLFAATVWTQWMFLIVMPIGFVVGLRNMQYASRVTATSVDWEREHLTSMITAGVTLHTAFFVFGTSRSLGWQLEGATALIPWAVPALVGLPTVLWLRSRR